MRSAGMLFKYAAAINCIQLFLPMIGPMDEHALPSLLSYVDLG